MRSVAPMARGDSRNRRARTGASGQGEHRVHAEGAQERALARHVRAADDVDAAVAAQRDVVADAAGARQERVPQRLPFQTRPIGDDFRVRIVRVLVGIAGKAGQGLELRHRVEPAADLGPRFAPPGIHGEGNLNAPEGHLERQAQVGIVRGAEPIDEAEELANALRRRRAVRHQPLLQRRQPGRRETLRFDAGQQAGEHGQVARTLVDRLDHLPGTLLQHQRDAPLDQEHDQVGKEGKLADAPECGQAKPEGDQDGDADARFRGNKGSAPR